MALKTYADWENAVKAARVNYDHSQAKMVTRTKVVKKSKKMAFLSVLSMTRAVAVSAEPIKSNKKSSNRSQMIQHSMTESENKMCLAQGKHRTIQILVETPLDSTFCLQLHPSTSISSLKGLLQDRLGIDPEKQHLFTREGFELCDPLSLEDHNIQQDTNLELRLVSGLMGGIRKHRRRGRSNKRGTAPPQDDSNKEKEPTTRRQDDTGLEGAAANDQDNTGLEGAAANDRDDTGLEGAAANDQDDTGLEGAAANVQDDTGLEGAAANGQDDTGIEGAAANVQDDSGLEGAAANDQPPKPSDITQQTNVHGDSNNIVLGDLHITHNFYAVPIETNVSRGDKIDDYLTKTAMYALRQLAEKRGVHFVKMKFYESFGPCDAELYRAELGSLRFIVHVRSRAGLDKLWEMYSTGVLAQKLTKVLITDELLTTEDKSNMSIEVKILQENYEKGCKFFQELPQDPASIELPVHMSDWTKYDVKRWLISLGVSDGVVIQLFDEEIDGRVLKLYTEDDLAKDFSINKRDMRLVMYERDNFVRQPESSTITKDTSFDDNKGKSVPLQDETHVHQIQSSTVEPEKKTGEVFNDIPQPSVRPKIRTSKATISSQKREKAKLPDTLPPHQSPRLDILPSSGKAKASVERDEPLQRPVSRGEMVPWQKPSEDAQKHDVSKPDAGKDVCPKPKDQTRRPPSTHGDDELKRQAIGEKNKKSSDTSPKGASSDTLPHMSAVEISKDDEAKVRMLLTGDEHGELSQSFYPVLVANKPDVLNKSTESEIDPFRQQFGFIKTIKWTAVLDFDSTSLSDGLCKLYHEDRMVTLQEPDLFKDIESEEDLRNNIGFPEKTLWVFANGREDNPDIRTRHMDLQEWNTERSGDVEASITFFSQPSVIPKGRASIVFLLLSDNDLEIVCDIFRKMSSSFKGLHNITCIAEDENVYLEFVKGVKKWFTKTELDERSVVGLKWQEINRIIMRMSGVNQVKANELPTRMPGKCFLSEKQKDEWDDITVVCKNECENTDMDESSQGYQKFAEKKELNFYRGAKVDWWNFSIGERERSFLRGCGHVLKRKGFGEMLKKVREPLDSSNAEDSLIVTVTLLHQPGAGGTTLARHVLWELRHDFRCIVVNRVTRNTVNQIMEARRHGYDEDSTQKIPPVCVLVDDIDEVELLDLIDELKDVSRDMHLDGGAVCVLLHCKRCSEPETLVDSESRELFIALTQKLDSREKEWFQKKYHELEKKEKELQTAEYNPEHLLAFMVMKEEFSKEYITHVVSKILTDIQPNEFKLIKLCAFLNSYRPEAAIPTSCCDSFMDGRLVHGKRLPYSTHKGLLPWENRVSSSFKIIVVAENNELRIFHESIAGEALRQTLQMSNQSLVDVAMEFLNCELFRSLSYSKQKLLKATHDLLVRRKRLRYGDDTDTDYAVLIHDICKQHEPGTAIEILKMGFEKLGDAFVAQQLARLCLKEHSIEMAHLYADKAVQIDPKNCYFWDTKGRVYKTIMQEKSSKYMAEQQVVDNDVCHELVSLSYEAMDAFHKSYEVSKEAKQTEYTGLYAEVEIAFKLLQVIYTCVEPFRTKGGKEDFKTYLLHDKPSDLRRPKLSNHCHTRIKNLKNRVDSVLNLLDDMSTFCKEDPTANTGKKLVEMKEHLKEFFKIYERYYGEPKPAQQSKYQDPTSLAEFRRRQVKESKCGTFRDIFDLARNKGELHTLHKSLHLLLENSDQYNFFDLKTIICIHLALSSAKEQFASAEEVYQQYVRPLNTLDHRKKDCFPPFFMMMFLWPVPDVDSERRDRYDLTYYTDELRGRWQNFTAQSLPQERRPSRHQNKPRTYFFLGQGKDLQVFAHINELHTTPGKIDRAESDDAFWSSRLVKDRLVRLEGTLQHHTSLVHLLKKGKINIKLAVPFKRQVPSQEAVTFYLGFTWDGPVAYDVKIKGKELREDAAPRFHHAYPTLNIHSEKSKTSLSKNLTRIDTLQKDCQQLSRRLGALLASSERHVKTTTSKGTVLRSRKELIRLYEDRLKEKQDELRRYLSEDTSSEDGP